ncbi:MAG: transcriptional repressor [Clostridia bacterium]|nr:transcriptional repressor [Clostridia bacterium]
MSQKAVYRTKQHQEIVDYLKSMKGIHLTAGEICAHFREQGGTISTATIYRQLEKLVKEGIINKYIVDENSSACFEYVGEHGKTDSGKSCFHCKCEQCGKLIHLECDELEMIQSHLMAHHDFQINPLRTVFYGLCSQCLRQSVAFRPESEKPQELFSQTVAEKGV